MLALIVGCGVYAEASTIYVAAGANLQQTLDAAQPGDTILLQEGAEFVGNFVLPTKTGDGWITIRTSAPDSVLPRDGERIQPSHSPLLARLRSSNSMAALRTAPGAHHWHIRYLEFPANQNGYGDIIQLGDGSSAQNTVDKVPHHLVLDHVYVHGDPLFGQKRCIALNAADVTIRDSHVSECKGVGQDTQAICGWNGPGPYTIENNRLEAAGEVVMFGGADPAIQDLVPSGITFRRNYLTRPMSWRAPIIGTPGAVVATSAAGGSLPPGVYAYRVVARGSVGQGSTGRSTASAEVVATVDSSSGGAVRIQWQPVEGASEYRVYGRTAGAQTTYWRVTESQFLDTGAAGTSEAVPTSVGTVWTVKNLFELKNARNVLVEDNVLENHWKEAQPGWSVVFTPRNSNGWCTWCVVEQVTFQYNLLRNVAAGVNLLGYDVSSRPTRQSNNIIVRQNLFEKLTTALGGNGWFMQIGDEPRDVTVEHNTIDSDGSTVVYTYGGTSTDPREIYGFRMVANAAKHGSYGFNGAFFSYGNGILTGFYPGSVFVANYLAGGAASRYPLGNFFVTPFSDQFVDTANGDFTPRAGSVLRGAAPDGTDIGVDFPELSQRLANVATGIGTPAAVPPTAGFSFTCTSLSCVFTSTSQQGDNPIALQSWSFGDGTQSTGVETAHLFPAAGSYSVALTVVDSSGLSSTASQLVAVTLANTAPLANFTSSCTNLVCSFVDASQDSDGTIVSASWNFGDGTMSSGGQVTHAFSAPGTYTVALTVIDDDGAPSTTSKTVTVTAANAAPVANFTASCTNLVCAFQDASQDSDGTIASVSWNFGDGTSATGAQVTHSFAASGTYSVTVTVVDDRGASASTTKPIVVQAAPVPNVVHGAFVSATTSLSNKSKNPSVHSWSAEVILAVHASDERAIGGATITAQWAGAATKTVSCVTTTAGRCTVKSGQLSVSQSTVSLSITAIAAPSASYSSSSNHSAIGGATTLTSTVTFIKP